MKLSEQLTLRNMAGEKVSGFDFDKALELEAEVERLRQVILNVRAGCLFYKTRETLHIAKEIPLEASQWEPLDEANQQLMDDLVKSGDSLDDVLARWEREP